MSAVRGRAMKDWIVKSSILAIMTFIIVALMSIPANAKDFFTIQTTINTDNWTIDAAVVKDTIGITGAPLEAKRVESSILESLASSSDSIGKMEAVITGFGTTERQLTTARSDKLVLTFPAINKGFLIFGRSPGATDADQARAEAVRDALLYDLKQAIELAWPDRSGIQDLAEFEGKMASLLNAAANGGSVGSVTFSKTNTDELLSAGLRLYDETAQGSDYIKARTTNGDIYYLLVRIPKGYVPITGRSLPRNLPQLTSSDDAAFVNWDMLTVEAFNKFLLEGDNADNSMNVYASAPTQMENVLVKLFASLLTGIKSALGLWKIDDLIYNTGLRGSSSYVHGVFPTSWEPVIWMFFVLTELVAILSLLYSIVNNVLKRATSTMNYMGRLHAWEQVKDIIVVALTLALLPVALQILLSLSYNLTGILESALQGETIVNLRNVASAGSGTLAGIVVQVLFFGIDVYYNFFYLLRSLTVAVLIVIAPICVVSATFDNKRKAMVTNWSKELLANIFIQPIHALVFAIILLFPVGTHAFDNIMLFYATIPFTSVIRGLFFGSAGSWGEQAAGRAKNFTTGVASGIAGGALAAAGGATAHAVAGKLGVKAGSGTQTDGIQRQTDMSAGSEKEAGLSGVGGNAQTDFSLDSNATQGGGQTASLGHGEIGGTGGGEFIQRPVASMARQAIGSLNDVMKRDLELQRQGRVSDSPMSIAQPGGKGVVLRRAAAIGGGIALGAIGGGLSAATGWGIGKELQQGGKMICAYGVDGISPSETEDEEDVSKEGSQRSGSFNDFSQLFSEDYNGPAELASNPLYQNGESAYDASRDMTDSVLGAQSQQEAGIANLMDQKERMQFDVDGDTAYGQEIRAYAQMLDTLPAEERQEIVSQTGIAVSPVMKSGQATGNYRVNIDKSVFEQATGTSISVAGKSIRASRQGKQSASMVPSFSVMQSTASVTTPNMPGYERLSYRVVEPPRRVGSGFEAVTRSKDGELVQETVRSATISPRQAVKVLNAQAKGDNVAQTGENSIAYGNIAPVTQENRHSIEETGRPSQSIIMPSTATPSPNTSIETSGGQGEEASIPNPLPSLGSTSTKQEQVQSRGDAEIPDISGISFEDDVRELADDIEESTSQFNWE